jgi:hypothetical protein
MHRTLLSVVLSLCVLFSTLVAAQDVSNPCSAGVAAVPEMLPSMRSLPMPPINTLQSSAPSRMTNLITYFRLLWKPPETKL